MIRGFATLSLYVLLALLEISFLASLPYPINLTSLVIPVLLIFMVSGHNREAWTYIFVTGILFDIFCFYSIGAYILIFAALYLWGRNIFMNYVSNASLLGVGLIGSAMVVPYWLLRHILNSFDGGLEKFSSGQEFQVILTAMLVNIAFVFIFYSLYRFFSKMGRPKKMAYGKI
ncbi:MAG: hypothetical protein PHW53_03340 [Patescibacteria group bacterium]|nr:hypothetical protein [Patescibacteria group bacterium]